jgi:hypothetical protein
MRFGQLVLAGVLAGLGFAGSMSGANAQALTLPGAHFAISCENGGNYSLVSGPAVVPGDVVIAHLFLSPHRGLPVRLMPMGIGYRYAGRGVWLDGIREHALLYLSKYHPVACIVSRA